MTAVKICGLTTMADARAAWQAGADLLGFVFVPSSSRCVTSSRAGEIVAALRAEGCHALIVGVFARQPADEVRLVATQVALDLVQLHGDETPSQALDLGLPVLLARRVRAQEPTSLYGCLADLASPGLWGGLLDAYTPSALGGTGTTWDWGLLGAERYLAHWRTARTARLLIAGGLTTDNVATAVRAARPWGVDVSSGVEAAPGHKDPTEMARFLRAVKECDG